MSRKIKYEEARGKYAALWQKLDNVELPDSYIETLISDVLAAASVSVKTMNNDVRHLVSHALAVKLEEWSLDLDEDNRQRPSFKPVK